MTAQELKAKREALKMSHLQFARFLGLKDRVTIYRFEKGIRPIPQHVILRLQVEESKKTSKPD